MKLLEKMTLAEVQTALASGNITREDAAHYVRLWNQSTFRFTHAIMRGDNILQVHCTNVTSVGRGPCALCAPETGVQS